MGRNFSWGQCSFINDCLLQPTLHVNLPLLQFVDMTGFSLSTVELFSRFYSHSRLELLRWPHILENEF